MLRWLELLMDCHNVTTKHAARAVFGFSDARLNVALTLEARRLREGYSLIEWKLK